MAINLFNPAQPGLTWWPQFLLSLLNALNSLDRSGTVTLTASGTIRSDDSTVLVNATTAAVTVTLPPVAECKGQFYDFKKMDATANAMILDGNGSETIDGATTVSTTTQYDSFTLKSVGTEWVIL